MRREMLVFLSLFLSFFAFVFVFFNVGINCHFWIFSCFAIWFRGVVRRWSWPMSTSIRPENPSLR